jgi:hypothetical protein
LNVAFFDGHVETLDDFESANPHMWIPTGGTLWRGSRIFDDVVEAYFGDEHIINIE